MKKVLISTFDLEVGGVERSLLSLLNHFDYESYEVDLMLYKQQGDFLQQLSHKPTLLEEAPEYATFRQTISDTLKQRYFHIGLARLMAKSMASYAGRKKDWKNPGIIKCS